jgi:membrane-associated protein
MEFQQLLHGDLKNIIETVGYIGVFTAVFLESGLLIGFFLPGDSLLFTAGLLASQGIMDIKLLLLGTFIAAVLGDTGGYFIGQFFGRRLFKNEDSLLFKKSHLEAAEKFYQKHGGKTIILSRFVPVIRAFTPVVAGISKMNYPTFVFYNFFGALLWAIGVTLAGFYLGSAIPNIDKYLLPIVGLIVLISIAPALYHALKTPENRSKTLKLLKLKR